MTKFDAFANEGQVATIGDLTIENGSTQIAVHGEVTISRDKAGLADAIALRDVAASIVAALSGQDLPDVAPEPKIENGTVKSPFD